MACMSADAVTRLRRIASALEHGELPDPGDAQWLTEGARRYLAEASTGVTLDRALGLKRPDVNRAWWSIERQRERDEAIRALRRDYFGNLGVTDCAIEMDRLFRRHRASTSTTCATDERARRIA